LCNDITHNGKNDKGVSHNGKNIADGNVAPRDRPLNLTAQALADAAQLSANG